MTDQPAMPLDNKEEIAAINRSINFLISKFIRPTAQQTVADAEAISRTEQLIESNARAIASTNAGFNAQQEVIQRLLLEIRSTNGAVAGLSDRINGLEAS